MKTLRAMVPDDFDALVERVRLQLASPRNGAVQPADVERLIAMAERARKKEQRP